MADFKVTKVWIEPGCIVCDACETECPEVFDVQADTCIVRPGAEYAGIEQQILDATMGCPVDVIRFETADGRVGTSDGLPGGEEEAAAPAEGEAAPADAKAKPAAASKAKKDVVPDETTQRLLNTARLTPGRSTEAGQAMGGQPARAAVPLSKVKMRPDWPADLKFTVLLGRPRRTLVKPEPKPTGQISGATRREFMGLGVALAAAWAAFTASALVGLGAIVRFMAPPYTPKKSPRFRAGKLDDYPTVDVYTDFKQSEQVWIVHLPNNRLVALSTICTHLGCTPSWLPNDQKFKCPCHGSGFRMSGINFEGPAPRPLPRYKIELRDGVVWVDKSREFREELGQWNMPDSYIQLA